MPHLWLLEMLKPPQSYKHHIERIAQDLSGYEPEVCLAVRLASSRPTSPMSDEEEEHNDIEIDGFLSSHGFEFIDAERNAGRNGEGRNLESNAWSSEIPGIERVLDALGTIMWPSMKTTSEVDTRSPQTQEHERALLDWANISQDNSLSAVEEMTSISGKQISARTKAMKREMEELARWLEEDDALRHDPWKSAVSTGEMSMSPTAMEHGGKSFGAAGEKFGFDDDFTVFVSAPALDATEISGRSTPDAPIDGLSPTGPHAGSLYRTLGSVSDFGGSEDGKDDDIDDELPSKEEIMATSSRIFGTSKFPLPPAVETRTNRVKTSITPEGKSSVTAAAKALSDDDLDTFATENFGADGDGSYDMEPFDLSKVLGALQEMKAEIANIEDEGERRRAAARVALGLVYGLEADAE
ncbi:hypothetical protein C0995_006573 [Termitomyces sp. Mi166|nr:hypothetical protein C0995_006573 [Termitomyces sp. Mi166\